MKTVTHVIHTPFIRLDSFLKLNGLTLSGGQAKTLIQEGRVLVNDECCTQRGKKLRPGDLVRLSDDSTAYMVGEQEQN